MNWTEFAIHKITFYLFRWFVMCIKIHIRNQHTSSSGCGGKKTQLVWLAVSSDNACYQRNPVTASIRTVECGLYNSYMANITYAL